MSLSRSITDSTTIFFKLLLICQISSPEPHSLVYILCGTSGIPKLPEFLVSGTVDGVEIAYCDSNILDLKPRTPWMNQLLEEEPHHLKWLNNKCFHNWIDFKATIATLTQRFNQSEGVQIFQRTNGCFWDDETEDFDAFNQYAYDGEDLISFDMKTLTWITPRHQTVITKHNWNVDGHSLFWRHALTEDCKSFLQLYLRYSRSSLQKAAYPSVSLLQKNPTSVVTCHATGFYPERASVFWRKDGQELHEGVERGEILPNTDGTFQMTVDLNIASIKDEDWKRYDCLFQFSSNEDNVTTRLDGAIIKTNQGIVPVLDYLSPAKAVPDFTVLLYE
ncbi:major histocompatibility complex class I-related gene protein-like [Cyprinodon tularosa]|uniref:major histocompatibility complex class I-related gene protein-like n=1 Tax=Cyprinodon tularosa TaxID=77115 RepID=UPI0018E279CC|nr:major histocompatibility complex class I-related gene protein-like [Cyprinodon tularosa]